MSGGAATRVVLAGSAFAVLALWTVPLPPAASSTTSHCAVAPHQICLSSRDGGRTTHARVGQRVTVTLSAPGQRWGRPMLLGRALSQVGNTVATGAGWAATYQAVRTGNSQIQATEQPNCAQGEACPAYVLLWRTTVTVTS